MKPALTLLVALSWPAVLRAGIDIAPNACLSAHEAHSRLNQVLAIGAVTNPVLEQLALAVDVQTVLDKFAVSLSVTHPDGRLLLQRRYTLGSADCPSATELLSTVVRQFASEVPYEIWAPVTPPPVSTAAQAQLGLAATGYLRGATLELTGTWAMGGSRWRWLAGASGTGDYPRRLGEGRVAVFSAAALGGVELTHGAVVASADLRAGVRRLAGAGFDEDYVGWLPRLELALGLRWAIDGSWIGPVVVLSPLRQEAASSGAQESLSLPHVRVGAGLFIPLGENS